MTGSDDKTLRFWQAGTGKMLAKVLLPDVPSQLDFDADGKNLIAGGKGQWWNIVLVKPGKDGAHQPAAEPFGPLPKGSPWHRAASRLPQKKLREAIPLRIDLVAEATLMPDGLLLEWDRQMARVSEDSGSGKPLCLVQGGKYYGAALAPNRRTLAVLQNDKDETITLFDLASGQQIDFWSLPQVRQAEIRQGPKGEWTRPGGERLDGWGLPQQEWLPDQPWLIPRIALVPGNRLLAVGTPRGSVLFFDLATSQQIHKVAGHELPVSLLAFSPDGKTMACAYRDATVLLWDCPKPANTSPTLTPSILLSFEQLWQQLESAEPPTAWKAHWGLVLGSTKTASFLKERLRPVRPVDLRPLGQRIKELDSDQFAVRARAMKDLEAMGMAAEPALLGELKQKVTLEKQRRLQQLLEKLNQARKRHVQELRALAVLEQIASPDAMLLLEALAAGDPQASLTIAAKASRKRLGK